LPGPALRAEGTARRVARMGDLPVPRASVRDPTFVDKGSAVTVLPLGSLALPMAGVGGSLSTPNSGDEAATKQTLFDRGLRVAAIRLRRCELAVGGDPSDLGST
jgi:hypothetical protein